MSQALPGTHLCVAHQGNHSHYAPENCELCRAYETTVALEKQLMAEKQARASDVGELQRLLRTYALELDRIWNGKEAASAPSIIDIVAQLRDQVPALRATLAEKDRTIERLTEEVTASGIIEAAKQASSLSRVLRMDTWAHTFMQCSHCKVDRPLSVFDISLEVCRICIQNAQPQRQGSQPWPIGARVLDKQMGLGEVIGYDEDMVRVRFGDVVGYSTTSVESAKRSLWYLPDVAKMTAWRLTEQPSPFPEGQPPSLRERMIGPGVVEAAEKARAALAAAAGVVPGKKYRVRDTEWFKETYNAAPGVHWTVGKNTIPWKLCGQVHYVTGVLTEESVAIAGHVVHPSWLTDVSQDHKADTL